ncbi:MAG: tyrosine-type recombinase/integrase [Methylovulum sp.]|nr:tyrosine-type recombinase/integrase [Methylovulum sp.]
MGGKAIAVPLNDAALAVIRDQIGKHQENVFSYKGNKIIDAHGKAWRKALIWAGINNFRWHDLRHTWASRHIQNGTPLHILKELGGWSDLTMVFRYAHLSSKHLEDYACNSINVPKSLETNLLHAQKTLTKKSWIQLISAIENTRTERRLAAIVLSFFQSDQRREAHEKLQTAKPRTKIPD